MFHVEHGSARQPLGTVVSLVTMVTCDTVGDPAEELLEGVGLRMQSRQPAVHFFGPSRNSAMPVRLPILGRPPVSWGSDFCGGLLPC